MVAAVTIDDADAGDTSTYETSHALSSHVRAPSAPVVVAVSQASSSPLSGSVSPSNSVINLTYDVLAMVDGLYAAGVEDRLIDAVAGHVCHLSVSSLDILRSSGIPAMKVVTVRRLLTPRVSEARNQVQIDLFSKLTCYPCSALTRLGHFGSS